MKLTEKQAAEKIAAHMAQGMHADEACINAILDQLMAAVNFENSEVDTYENSRLILAEYVAGQKRLDLTKDAQRQMAESN